MTDRTTLERGRDGGPGILAADDPDIEVLAQLLVQRIGNGRQHDLYRRTQARRLLRIFREFQNRTASVRAAYTAALVLEAALAVGHKYKPDGLYDEMMIEVADAIEDAAAALSAGSPAALDEPTLQALLRELLQGSGEMYSFASEFIWRRTAEYAALSAGSPAAEETNHE